jgi:hypothetical protein
MTKWISGGMKAPPRSELIRGLQYACSGRGYDPASFSIKRLGQPGLAANEGRSLFAAHAVQRYVGKGFVPPERGPVVSLDRLAATFEVRSRKEFRDFIFRSMLPHPPRGNEFAPFKFSFKSDNIHISFQPQGPRHRVHPDTGEILDANFARIELFGRLLTNLPKAKALLNIFLHPFLDPGTLDVTLVDIAVDYDVPSFAVLHHDERTRKSTSGRPRHPWLQNEALNWTFGGRTSQRFIRTYDKLAERADRILDLDEELAARLQAEAWMNCDPDGGMLGEPSPDGLTTIEELRLEPSWRSFYPEHMLAFSRVHRVEASCRPKGPGQNGIDRRPPDLLDRIRDRVRPFEGHHLVHVGLLDPGDFWTPFLVRARADGVPSVQQRLHRLQKNHHRQASSDGLLERIIAYAHLTEQAGLESPARVLDRARPALQRQLDDILGVRRANTEKPVPQPVGRPPNPHSEELGR